MNDALKKTVLALAVVGIAGVAQADVVSGLSYSDPGGVRVGKATYPRSDAGKPGAGVDGQLRGAIAATSHFANAKYRDDNGVYHYSGRRLVDDGAPSTGFRDHSKLGV